jgi:hypothetical protein
MPASAYGLAAGEELEMKRPLEFSAVIAIKKAAGYINDACDICRKLQDQQTEQQLRNLCEQLELIFDDMQARSMDSK